MVNAPLSETMQALLVRGDRLSREAEKARLAWREKRDEVALLERDYKLLLQKELARLSGEGDAHYRKVTAEANAADAKYRIDLARSLAGSAHSAWKERLEEMETLRAAFNAYNRELRELGG